MNDEHSGKWDELREQIIGLGNKSARKSYFPELQQRLEELSNSESDLRTLFHSLYDAIFVHDLEGNIIDVNDSMLRMYHIDRDQVFNYSVFDYCATEEMVGRVQRFWSELSSGYAVDTFEGKAMRPLDGSEFDIEVGLHWLNWQGQRRIVAVVKDISERKSAELMRLRDEARLEALLQLGQLDKADIQTISDFVVKQAIELTSSTIGFVALVDEEETVITMYSWSSGAFDDKAPTSLPTVFRLEDIGLLGEVVRQRKPVLTNDYVGLDGLKRSLPPGHVSLARYLSVPALENGKVFALVGVGNKRTDYDQGDIRQLSLLMEGMLSIYRRRRAEEAIRESQSFLDTIVNNTPIAIYYKDLNGVYLGCNKAFAALQNVEPADLVGKTVFDLKYIHAADILDQKDLELQNNGGVQRFEIEDIAPDGSTRQLMLQKALYYDLNGNPKGIIGAILDLTDRKKAEDAVRREKDLNDAIFNSIPGMIYLYDDQGRLVKWNTKHELITGYGPDELRGKMLLDWYKDDPVSQRSVTEGVKRTLEAGFGEAEADLQTKSGARIPMYFTASPVTVDGKLHFVGVGIDITERRRIQQALENRILALTQPLDDSFDIELDDLLDVKDIQLLQDQFAEATGVASVITRINGQPITRPSNFCRLCSEVIRKTEKGLANCYKSDAALGMPSESGPTVKPCLSGGLWDAGASIMIGGRHIASWLIGQVRNEAQSESTIRAYAKKIGVDEEDAVKAFYEVPSMSEEQFQNVAKALYTLAKQLSTVAYQNVQQARFIADRQKASQELKRQLDLEHIIMEISGEFISMPAEKTVSALNHAVARLGEFLGADRAYIYRIEEEGTLFKNENEWCAEGIDSVHRSITSVDVGIVPVFTRTILSGAIFSVEDSSQMGTDLQAEKVFTDQLHVKSCINIPIQMSGQVCGFLGFETTREARKWPVGEVDLLKMFAHRVGSKLERNRYEEEIQRLNANLEMIVAERTEQLMQSNKELESFAYSISHDLRAPLRSINGFSAALQHDYEEVLDETAGDYIARIRSSATRMSDQIDGLLTLSRISRVKLEVKDVDLSDMAYVIVGNLRDIDPSRKLSIEIQKDMVISGDERLLMSLMQNLLENAWKFTSTVEQPLIRVSMDMIEGEKVVTVEDNGVGFEMAYADKLFGVFQRLHASTEFPGTGIGLATAQRIVHRHEGRIWAESEPGKGSKFMFTLGE